MTVADDLATVERELRNYHDSGCFVYLPSGTCDCGMEPPAEALAAHKRVEAEIARLEERAKRLEERANFADAYKYRQRAEAAEAEIARLKDGLRQAQECCARPPGVCFNPKLAEDGAARCGVAGHRCDNWPECSHVLATLEAAEDGAACDHGITLQNRETGRERCAECGAIVSGGAA